MKVSNMKLTTSNLLALLSLPLLTTTIACTDPDAAREPPQIKSALPRDLAPAIAQPDFAAQVAGNTAFAAELYGQIAAGAEDDNLIFSPHSISTALAMTYAGAGGTTATQMADVLHFDPELVHAAMNKLDLALEGQLHAANAIWAQQDYPFEAPFLDTLGRNYGAGVYVQDFETQHDLARRTINDWVAGKTNDKIQELLPDGTIDETTRLVLTNAVHFSAQWKKPFSVEATTSGSFAAVGGARTVPMMRTTLEGGSYASGAGWSAAELPYDGEQTSMVVIEPEDLAAFEAGLDGAKLAEIVAALAPAAVDLTLPKWKFELEASLADSLKALGMVDAFEDVADFTAIADKEQLRIKDVRHKAFIGVDEKGTEAAAATAVIVGPGSSPEVVELVIDKPFLFAIRHRETGAILFLGRVTRP